MHIATQQEKKAADNVAPAAVSGIRLQPKLSIGAVNDPLEHEADAMADKVMSMQGVPSVVAAGAGAIQRKCSHCEEEEEKMQRKPLASFIQRKESSAGAVAPDAVSNKINSSKGSGNNMDSNTQSFMQSRFGTDFSDVKIHTDSEAMQMNRELSAKAFTVGNDIYFNQGQYNPGSDEGKHLLAHELTHTVQQSESNQSVSSTVIRRTPADDAKALAKKIHDAISGAKTDETTVLDALGTLGRDATKAALLKTTYKTEYTTELEADIKSHLSGDKINRALFLLNAPPAETTLAANVTAVKSGTEAHTAKVGGGNVSVHTGVDYKPVTGGSTWVGGFSVGYKGSKTSESRFLQTIWSEVVSTQPDKIETWVAKTGIGTSNGTMDLTTDPKKPKYKIDSASAISPFYESGGTHVRTATGNTNYDRPGEFSDIIAKQFDAGATKVVERDHFDDFLVQEENVVYHVSLVVEWVYTSKTAVTKSTKFGSGAVITALPTEVKKQLVKEYPKFEYIK